MSKVEELQLSEISLCLQLPEKAKRLQSLEKFQRTISGGNWSKSELVEIWQVMNRPIAARLTDPAESCRNVALDVTRIFLESLPVIGKNIMYLMPVLVKRLGCQEILEPSEEVRLTCVILLQLVIKEYKEFLAVYIDDLVAILTRTVTDDYPKVKIESCEAIAELAQNAPAHFYGKSEAFVKPVLSNFSHQQYRVRVASIRAIGRVLLHGNSKNLPEVASAMAARLFDQSAAVRIAVIEVAGDWLINLRDRYSWWFKVIPLLLTGLHDQIEDIRKKSGALWTAVGEQYLQENDNDEKVKDKLDYLIHDPEHYPPNIMRPNLGCRLIVQQNIGKLIPGMAAELDDWLADIRVRSAQLLAVLFLNAEHDTIQHIEKILPAMYKACADEDARVSINVLTAAEYLGYFVPPNTYCQLILPTLDDGNIHFGHLACFAAILRASPRDQLSKELETIAQFLDRQDICRSKKEKYQAEVLKCCQALIQVCQKDCHTISKNLFTAIFTSWSMSQVQTTHDLSKNLLQSLSDITDSGGVENLYRSHLPSLLQYIESTAITWTAHSSELSIFKLCLTQASALVLENHNILLQILKKTMSQESEVELKLKLFILLSEMWQNRSTVEKRKDVDNFLMEFFQDILIPCLIWTAGRSAEALRTAAIGCFCGIFDHSFENESEESIFSTAEDFSVIFRKVKPMLMSLIDDNSRRTRLFALRAMCLIVRNRPNVACVTEEDVVDMYPVVLRRLDDGCDDIRSAAVETLVFVWKVVNTEHQQVGKTHVDFLYTSAIVHLDDPEETFHRLMLDCMMELAKIRPELLLEKIEKCKVNFRNQQALEKLQNRCHQLINGKVD